MEERLIPREFAEKGLQGTPHNSVSARRRSDERLQKLLRKAYNRTKRKR